MCVVVPGRVLAVGPQGADVMVSGRRMLASTLLIGDVQVGDHVLVSLGTIIERITEEEAQIRLHLFDFLEETLSGA